MRVGVCIIMLAGSLFAANFPFTFFKAPTSGGGSGGSYSNAVYTSTPYIWYRLNETGTNAADVMGHNNGLRQPNSGANWTGGTNATGVTPLNTSAGASAYISNSVPGYVTAGDVNALDGLSAITVECWVKYVSSATDGNNKVLVAKANPAGSSSWALRLAGSGQNIEFMVTKSSSDNSSGAVSVGGFGDGNWWHIVGRYDGANVSIWTNGVKGAQAALTGAFDSTSANVKAGQDDFPLGSLFAWSGFLGDVAIYTTALSDAEILDHYNKGK